MSWLFLPLPLGRATPDSASNTELFPELWSPITAIAGSAKSFSTPRERRESMRSMQGRTFSSYCWFKLFMMKVISDQSEPQTLACICSRKWSRRTATLAYTHKYFRFLRKESIRPASLGGNETQYMVCQGITKKLGDSIGFGLYT